MKKNLRKRLSRDARVAKSSEAIKQKLNEVVEQLNRNSDKIKELTILCQLFMAELIILKRKGYITDEEIKNELDTDSKNPEGSSPESEEHQSDDERLTFDEPSEPTVSSDEGSGANVLEEKELSSDNLPLSLSPSD